MTETRFRCFVVEARLLKVFHSVIQYKRCQTGLEFVELVPKGLKNSSFTFERRGGIHTASSYEIDKNKTNVHFYSTSIG